MNIFRAYFSHWRTFNKNIKSFLIFDFCNQLSLAVYVLYFPRYLIELGYQEDLYGSFLSISAMMMAIFAIIAGVISDRIGRRNSLIIGIGISKITYITRAFLVFLPVLYGSHIINGIIITLYNSTSMPFIYENATPENRIHAYSLQGIFWRLSSILGNLLGGLLPALILTISPGLNSLTVYRIIFAFSLLFAGFGFLQLFNIKPSEDEKYIAAQKKGKKKVSFIQEIKSLPRDNLIFVMKFVIVRGTIMLGAGMFLPFMNTYFLRKFNAGPEITGLIFSLSNVAVILGIALAPSISERLGMEKAIIVTRVLSFPMFVIMAFAPSIYWVALAYLARNTLQQMSGPLQNTFIMNGLDRQTRATANGILSAAGNGSRSIALFLAGNLIVKVGYSSLFLIALVFYVLSAAFFYKFFIYDPKHLNKEVA